MFCPNGTQPLAPLSEKFTWASLSMLISNGRLKRISMSWFGMITRLPFIAKSLKLDLRRRPGMAWFLMRVTA